MQDYYHKLKINKEFSIQDYNIEFFQLKQNVKNSWQKMQADINLRTQNNN